MFSFEKANCKLFFKDTLKSALRDGCESDSWPEAWKMIQNRMQNWKAPDKPRVRLLEGGLLSVGKESSPFWNVCFQRHIYSSLTN